MSEENNIKSESKNKEDGIVTIHDFKSMLVGMDMVLGDEWTPNEEQWKRIRRKLDALIETAERPGGAALRPPLNSPVAQPGNVSDAELLTNFPNVPGSVPANVPVGEAGPAGPSALAPPQQPPQPRQNMNAPVADGTQETVKTPDIDTTGGYKSSFV